MHAANPKDNKMHHTTSLPSLFYFMGAQIFQKCTSDIKTLGAKWITCSKLCTENPKISDATVQNLIIQEFCTLHHITSSIQLHAKMVEVLSFSQITVFPSL
jgi:hypothetical protein